MKKTVAVLLALASLGMAQSAAPVDLARETAELTAALQSGDLVRAADIAAKLDDAIQARKLASMVSDSSDRARDALSWLPADIEAFWVNQVPFVNDEKNLKGSIAELAIRSYSFDRLAAQNGGHYFDLLRGQTVRLAMGAARGTPPESNSSSIPGSFVSRDVIYFYFLTGAWTPPKEDEMIQGRPAWQGKAAIIGPYTPRPGVEPPTREDTNWIALARPDLLIVSNQKDLLSDVLKKIVNPAASPTPVNFPEWSLVNRSASLWGFRHYTDASKPRPGQRGCSEADLPTPDCRARGLTLQFNAATHLLEIHYLSNGPLKKAADYDSVREFQIEQPAPGDWRLVSDLQKRGAFPLHFGMVMLGFGVYR